MTGVDAASIAARYHTLSDEVHRLGGDRVRIVAVTKSFPVEAALAVRAAGCVAVGENYAQEVVAKYSVLAESERPEIHFIGQLQSNKIRLLAPLVSVFQTVDRTSLTAELARRRPGASVMIQINLTGESDKGGCAPEKVEGLLAEARGAGLGVVGLMTVGPTHGDPEITRRVFRDTATMAARLALPEVSMGMSGDWRIAVEEGATLIRVGSVIFGDRPPLRG